MSATRAACFFLLLSFFIFLIIFFSFWLLCFCEVETGLSFSSARIVFLDALSSSWNSSSLLVVISLYVQPQQHIVVGSVARPFCSLCSLSKGTATEYENGHCWANVFLFHYAPLFFFSVPDPVDFLYSFCWCGRHPLPTLPFLNPKIFFTFLISHILVEAVGCVYQFLPVAWCILPCPGNTSPMTRLGNVKIPLTFLLTFAFSFVGGWNKNFWCPY